MNRKLYIKEYRQRNRDRLNALKKIWTRKSRASKKKDKVVIPLIKEPVIAQISLFGETSKRHCVWCGLLKTSKFCVCGADEYMIESEDQHMKNNCVICGKSLSEKKLKNHKPRILSRREMLKNYLNRGNFCGKCCDKASYNKIIYGKH